MRFADNFNPEWGYLAPAPRFMRTLRIAVVAAAVGASAGGAAVFSLIGRPAAEETSVAARTLARPDDTISALARPTDAVSALKAPQAQVPQPAAAESKTRSTSQEPTSSAALAEAPLATDAAATSIATNDPVATLVPDATATQKKVPAKKSNLTWRSAPREQLYGTNRAPLALMPPSAARRGQYYGYAPRGGYYADVPRDEYYGYASRDADSAYASPGGYGPMR
jgi:hypothetical protein